MPAIVGGTYVSVKNFHIWPAPMIMMKYDEKAYATAPMRAICHRARQESIKMKKPSIIMKSKLAGDGSHKPYTSLIHDSNALLPYDGAIWNMGIPENSELVHHVVSPVSALNAWASCPFATPCTIKKRHRNYSHYHYGNDHVHSLRPLEPSREATLVRYIIFLHEIYRNMCAVKLRIIKRLRKPPYIAVAVCAIT